MSEKEYKEMIYEKASKVKTKEELNALIDEITNFNHDYGTIVYGCMAAMQATFNVIEESPNGGITGFQAGCLGWECVHTFMMTKPPCKLLDYNNLLFPQYAKKFEKIISPSIWEHVQKKAKESLEEHLTAHPDVVSHWQSIVSGTAPFGFVVEEMD